MITETLREFNIGRYQVEIECIDYCQGSDWLGDMFDVVGEHEGGVTVRNPVNAGDNKYHQWYTPKQYTLAELASDYAKQGLENPSKDAYESAQRELGWYITASDFGFQVTVKRDDVVLVENNAGLGFDFSWEYSKESLADYCWANFRDVITECLHEAIEESRDTLEKLAA